MITAEILLVVLGTALFLAGSGHVIIVVVA